MPSDANFIKCEISTVLCAKTKIIFKIYLTFSMVIFVWAQVSFISLFSKFIIVTVTIITKAKNTLNNDYLLSISIKCIYGHIVCL